MLARGCFVLALALTCVYVALAISAVMFHGLLEIYFCARCAAIHVVDKYTVKFELAMPDPKFYLNVVDSLSPVIVPREAVEAPGGLAENPIGTGAFSSV